MQLFRGKIKELASYGSGFGYGYGFSDWELAGATKIETETLEVQND